MAAKATAMTLLVVKKMDRAIEFYTKKLGAKLVMRGTGEMEEGWAEVSLAGATFWLVAPDTKEKRTLAYQGLVVPNIKRTVTDLQKKGVKFDKAEEMGPDSTVDGPISSGPFGASAFFKDTEGNLWMLFQAPAM
jgi:catechol 2,3-dioxygenase-like lactoylglutathione lyase family enzyme